MVNRVNTVKLYGGRGLHALQRWNVRFDRLAGDSVAPPPVRNSQKGGGTRASASAIAIVIAIENPEAKV